MAINKPLPSSISLKSKWVTLTQVLIYENKGLYCQKCRKYGHITTECKHSVNEEEKGKMTYVHVSLPGKTVQGCSSVVVPKYHFILSGEAEG